MVDGGDTHRGLAACGTEGGCIFRPIGALHTGCKLERFGYHQEHDNHCPGKLQRVGKANDRVMLGRDQLRRDLVARLRIGEDNSEDDRVGHAVCCAP